MAMAFVQGVAVSGAAGTSPQALTAFATAVAVGNLIVVMAGGDGGVLGAATSVSDSLGNSYTRVPSFDIANAGGTLNMDAFYAVVTNAGSSNVVSLTFNSAVENCVVVVQHFNGFVNTPTLDKIHTSSNVSSTTITSGATAALANATELVIGMGIHASTVSTISLGSGYTNLTAIAIANRQSAMESKVVAATTAVTATFTIALARVNMGAVLTFQDVAGGTTTTTTSTTAAPLPKTNTLIDDFNGTSLNASLWDNFVSAGTTFTVNNEVDFAMVGTSGFAGLTTHVPYDATNSAISYQLVDAGIQTWVSKEISFGLYANGTATNSVYAIVGDGGGTADAMSFYKKVAGVQTQLWSAAYDAVNHMYQRITEASGTLTFDTSADGLSWTTRWTGTTPVTLSNVVPQFNIGHYATETGTSTVKIDKVNVIPSAGGPVITGQFFPFMGL